jgi:hypothetical protein
MPLSIMAKRPLGNWVLPSSSPPKRVPGLNGSPVAAPVFCHGKADAVDLAGFQCLHKVARGADATLAEVLRAAALDEDLLAMLDGAFHLEAEACLSQIWAARSHQFLVEPRCAIMGDLLVQSYGGQHC